MNNDLDSEEEKKNRYAFFLTWSKMLKDFFLYRKINTHLKQFLFFFFLFNIDHNIDSWLNFSLN